VRASTSEARTVAGYGAPRAHGGAAHVARFNGREVAQAAGPCRCRPLHPPRARAPESLTRKSAWLTEKSEREGPVLSTSSRDFGVPNSAELHAGRPSPLPSGWRCMEPRSIAKVQEADWQSAVWVVIVIVIEKERTEKKCGRHRSVCWRRTNAGPGRQGPSSRLDGEL
jgi:hypothetical protein